MKQKGTEYKLIIIINVLLVIYTGVFLYGIPYALYDLFSTHTVLVVLGWTLYAGSLYLVLIRSEDGMKNLSRCFASALLIGIGTAIIKAIIEVLTNQLFSLILLGGMRGATAQGIRNGVIGVLFIYFLFHFFSKGKFRLSNNVSKQKTAMIAVIVSYILIIIMIKLKVNISFDSSAYDLENVSFFTFMEWANLGVNEIICVNRWFFSIFMVVSWWMMRALYAEDKENIENDDRKQVD